ncbi:hypothetical protein [Rhodococcoides fascians]|uniref:hypothetical protein n=1 Tax=Rhodococcoides fascians TaxID=1828 RepID=UPI00056ABF0F|nr:hypothetical protein [Rhodococcus fascians]
MSDNEVQGGQLDGAIKLREYTLCITTAGIEVFQIGAEDVDQPPHEFAQMVAVDAVVSAAVMARVAGHESLAAELRTLAARMNEEFE